MTTWSTPSTRPGSSNPPPAGRAALRVTVGGAWAMGLTG
jgi:hypothetical protein